MGPSGALCLEGLRESTGQEELPFHPIDRLLEPTLTVSSSLGKELQKQSHLIEVRADQAVSMAPTSP